MKRLLTMWMAMMVSSPAWAGGSGLLDRFDETFGTFVVGPLGAVLFFDLAFWDNGAEGELKLPIVVVWLVLGAVYFTLRMQFINLRGLRHAVAVTRGDYDNPDDPGEISHFQALSSALSATVGLGNIAGVAIAVGVGGPGAVFWMVVAGFLGMSSKFTECTLGQMYRSVDSKGQILGGPMRYLSVGLAEKGYAKLGRVLAIVFALMCIGGSFGGGNMFQANQSFAAVGEVVPLLGGEKVEGEVSFVRAEEAQEGEELPARTEAIEIMRGTVVEHEGGLEFRTLDIVSIEAGSDRSAPVRIKATEGASIERVDIGGSFKVEGLNGVREAKNTTVFEGGKDHRAWLYGLILAIVVGMVILGGIKRIGMAASIIVPVMCAVYVLAGLWILGSHAAEVPDALGKIFSEAFSPEAGRGGLIGVLIQGFRRAAFSNEAGTGSASIAHSAAATDEPVREGIVALLEPFIDTIIVCTMTGLVVVITGAYLEKGYEGVAMTSLAFGSVISWFPLLLSFAVVMFAFSTMISWSYYGERCTVYLFGNKAVIPYKIVFLAFVFFGSVFKLGNVLEFSDLMILGMAFPNILGILFLTGKVKAALDDYWARYRSGEMKRVK
jgi:Na+/alanine symporter